MGYLKHVHGDDMTPEEKARLDHAELVETAQAHGGCLTSRALWKHHDRLHGTVTLCRFCQESALDRVAEAFARPAQEPTIRPTPTETHRVRSPGFAGLERAVFGGDLIGDVFASAIRDALEKQFGPNVRVENVSAVPDPAPPDEASKDGAP